MKESLEQKIIHAESLRNEKPEEALALTIDVWEQYILANEFNLEVQTKTPRLLFSTLLKTGADGTTKAIALAEKYLEHASVKSNPLLQAEMIYLKSKSLRYSGQSVLSLPLALQALAIFDSQNYNQGNYFEVLGGLSYNYLILEKYEPAFLYNRKHLELAKVQHEIHQQCLAMYNQAILHERIGNLHESLTLLIQLLRFAQKNHPDPASFDNTYADIATALNSLGKFKTAERFYLKGMNAYQAQGNEFNVVWTFMQYCVCLQTQNKFAAIEQALQDYGAVLERNNFGNYSFQIANYKAVVLLHKGKAEQAALYISLLLQSFNQPLQAYEKQTYLGTLGLYYEQTGNHQEALKYYKLLAENRVEVFNTDRNSNLRSLQIQLNIAGAKKEKEQAEKLAQLKQEFLANMSHEIRSPMNAVIALSSLLAEEKMSDEQQKKVNIIKRSSENLLGIINDILDNAKIEAGKFTIEHIPFSLRELVSDVENMVAFKTTEKNIALKVEVAKTVPDFVQGDPTRLRQVLINLLNNAVKFTKAGSVQLKVERQEKNANFSFTVTDTGIGISKEQIEKIFAGYTQASADTARNFGGTGLGLKISKELIQLMGGNLKVESELEKGTEFSFALPFAIANEISKPETNQAFIYKGEKQFRFLIADDLEDNRFVVKELLKKCCANLIISEAENGKQALAQALENNFDLIVMDIDMPEMNGIEASVQIRTTKPQQKILGSSANVMMGAEDLKSFGFTDFLLKPFTKNQFEEKMRSLLEEK